MPAHDDALDRLLDRLARGSGPEPVDLDRATGNIARYLFHLGRKPAPSREFVDRLEATLMERIERMPATATGPRPLHLPVHSARWVGRAVAAVALAACLVVASLAIFGRGPGER